MHYYMDVLLTKNFLGNTLWDYTLSLGLFIVGLFLISVTRFVFLKKLHRWAVRTSIPYDEILIGNIQKKIIPLLYFGAIYFSLMQLNLSNAISRGLYITGMAVTVFFTVRFIMAIIVFWFDHYWKSGEDDGARKSVGVAFASIIKVILWSTAILIFLDNMGIKISAVIAGLGIGGVAVAFAAQALLGDIFSYFSILLDNPFEIGDFVVVDTFRGTVEHIGIKTTRIRSLSGEELVFPNADLTSSRLQNFKRLERRRVAFRFGVTYETQVDQLKQIPVIVKEIIDSIELADFDRAHFLEFGDFSLNYEVVYFVNHTEYEVYCGIQQEINLKLKDALDTIKVEFAYPTSTVYLKQ